MHFSGSESDGGICAHGENLELRRMIGICSGEPNPD
jgi:hypothetical protein